MKIPKKSSLIVRVTPMKKKEYEYCAEKMGVILSEWMRTKLDEASEQDLRRK